LLYRFGILLDIAGHRIKIFVTFDMWLSINIWWNSRWLMVSLHYLFQFVFVDPKYAFSIRWIVCYVPRRWHFRVMSMILFCWLSERLTICYFCSFSILLIFLNNKYFCISVYQMRLCFCLWVWCYISLSHVCIDIFKTTCLYFYHVHIVSCAFNISSWSFRIIS